MAQASENNWRPARLDPGSDQLIWKEIPGTNNVTLQLQKGWPATIMTAVAADFNAYVEPLRDADSASYTPTNSVDTSNHLNATAMDLNWNSHAFKVRGTFSAAQMRVIEEMEDFYEGNIFWAGRWDSPVDEMHWQMGYDTWNNPKVADFITRKIRPDGFSTFRRGATQPVPQPDLSRSDRYAVAIIREGQRRNITERGIVIALSVALVESNLTMYANSSVPESMSIPHDKVGSDHDSLGLFQQRCPMWGPANVLMDPTLSAGLFYDRLENMDYNNTGNSPGWYAAEIQRPAAQYRGRYDERMGEAQALYNRLVGVTPIPTPIPIPVLGSDFMSALTEQEQRLLFDKTLQIWGALFNPVPSQSRYGDPKDKWATKDFIRNDDGFLFDLITEHDAALGDPAALDRVRKAATAGDSIAQHFLEKLTAAPLPPPTADDDTPENNITCWNCGKHYPDSLPTCPFCGATQERPSVPPGPIPIPGNPPEGMSVDQDVVDQFSLLQRFNSELPEEVSSAIDFLIPVLKGLVK